MKIANYINDKNKIIESKCTKGNLPLHFGSGVLCPDWPDYGSLTFVI